MDYDTIKLVKLIYVAPRVVYLYDMLSIHNCDRTL